LEAQIGNLTEIQKLDNQISEVLSHKEVYPKKIRELSTILSDMSEKIEELKASISESEKERKRLQDQINVDNERIERVDAKLPQIKTNKEYQALIKEIDNMRKEISICEDRTLVLLEEEEGLQLELKAKVEELESKESDIKTQISGYESEMGKFDEKINKFEFEKDKLTKHVDKKHLLNYERIKERRDGVAIVPAVGGVCQGCFMNLPPQLFNLIQRSDDIHTCPNCNRILFWREE